VRSAAAPSLTARCSRHRFSALAQYFRTPIAVDVKADASPVTAADRAAEAAMRALIAARAPSHAVFGEEAGLTRGAAGGGEQYVWVLDPIDGTKSFITGKPLFGTLIALVRADTGEPVLGLIDQPILRERWLGVTGAPTTLNGAPVGVRRCGRVQDAYMYSTTPFMFDAATRPAYDALADAVRMPMYGCDCYAYGACAGVCAFGLPHRVCAVVCDAPLTRGAAGLLSMGLCDLVVEARRGAVLRVFRFAQVR
jgi:inositol-phosphate phosphatase/L-galactose 1-phosphate phosphatase/histidinol-phosphatase